MTNTTHLQGIGEVEGIPAKELKVGQEIIWNYGFANKVLKIEFSKSKKTLNVTLAIKDVFGNPTNSVRKLGSERIVAVR